LKSENLLKLEKTILELAPEKKVALAFSKGVDSSILLEVLRRLDMDVFTFTFDTNIALEIPQVALNTRQRCYFCKTLMLSTFKKIAFSKGYNVFFDGTNADDLLEFRPGLKAIKEQGILSPIAKAGLSKTELREIGKELGLDCAAEPSSPCYLTRFPYDTLVNIEMIKVVEEAEKFLKENGFKHNRVRIHKEIARIEVLDLKSFLDKALIEDLLHILSPIGVKYITLDMLGLRSGSMDL